MEIECEFMQRTLKIEMNNRNVKSAHRRHICMQYELFGLVKLDPKR